MSQWNFDPAHSNAEFSVKHMMISTVRGSMSDLKGSIDFDPENPGDSSVQATFNVTSINTGMPDRDNHLRSADFFDVEKYPTIEFKSTKVVAHDKNSADVVGDLTIKDVTKSVTLKVEYLGQATSPQGDTRAGFEARTEINREDFGLKWNQLLESGGVLVGKDIKIVLDIQAIQA
ncbi:YceI family protein [Anaerolineales bacterium]